MKKYILLCITTITLFLFSNVSFSQTLELGILSSFEAYTGAGGVTNEGQMFGDAGTHNGVISGLGFGQGYTGTTYPTGSPTSYQARIDLLRVYVHLSDVFVTYPGTHSAVFGGGETIFPGVYSIPGAGTITGALTLDGQGDSNAVFIIKYEGALTVGTSSTIILSNGTRAANVFWIAEGAIQVGANSVIKGTLFSHPGAVSLGLNCTIEGRLLASEGAITIGAGSLAEMPAGPISVQINCLGTCVSNSLDVLGSVKSFAMFTSDGAVSNAATSGFIGDIGTHSGAITGFGTSTHALGDFYNGDLVTAQAAQDLNSAYNQLMAVPNTQLGHSAAFGSGEILQPGVYYIAGAGSLAGTIVLDANNDPDAIFVFKFLGAFSVAAQSKVILRRGARRCNIFWISGAGGTGAIDIGTFVFMKGTLLAHGGACTAAANVNLEGRLLSTAGAIGFSTGVIYNDTLCFEDEIAIIKTGLFVDTNGNLCAEVGETIDYTFTVTNEGNEILSAIALTDPLVPAITFVSGDTNGDMKLDLTETWIYTGTYIIDQGDIVAGEVSNQALASAVTYNGFLITDSSDDNSVLEDDPTITKLSTLCLVLIQKIDILCNGNATGLIGVSATGGVPPYMFTLNGGAPQTGTIFNNLMAGVYTIQVIDSAGGTATTSATLYQPNQISIGITKTNSTSTSLCQNGTATATPSGGVGPYTYVWDDPAGQTTPTAVNLTGNIAGGTQYNVTVTDANGCTSVQGVIITCVLNCDAVISVNNVDNVLCKNQLTGSTTVSASSAANPGATFTFTWNTIPAQVSSGVTSSTINNLGAGVYTVSVTIDGTLCLPVGESIIITEPGSLVSVTTTATGETGPTTNDGTATANPSGGTQFTLPAAPYTYSWNTIPIQTTQTITALDQGTYTVTVTDANGCQATTNAVVQSGSCLNLGANAIPTGVSCNGGNDGSATVSVTGGLGPFTYSWNTIPVQTTQTITSLIAGAYIVTVVDTGTTCTATSTATVGEPSSLSSGIAVTNVACNGDATGSIDLTPSGGIQNYTFLWSPGGQTTEDLSVLVAGTYSVVITDANGCTRNDSATVIQPLAPLSTSITAQTNVLCFGGATGSATVTATGGTPVYSYSWNTVPVQTTAIAT
ncbi:MAG: putative repeat protein (TIGR01451 family), partial [Ulvibacter sp.]